MDALFDQYLGQTLVGALAVLLGIALYLNERNRTIANRLVAVFLVMVGLAGPILVLLDGRPDLEHWRALSIVSAVLGGSVLAALVPYVRSLVTIAGASQRLRGVVDVMAVLAYAAAIFFLVVALAWPRRLFADFYFALDEPADLASGRFWVFGSVFLMVGVLFTTAWIILSRLEVDPGERARAICFGMAAPLLTMATFLSPRLSLAAYTGAIGFAMFGYFRYFGAQGERAVFLSRFLSPQVAELVRLRGLAAITQPQELDLSVVCIDFRGFTPYAEAIPTQAVIDMISDYHEAIGDVVAEHGGMVKDYAGDGILILVGAPIARTDHAPTALAHGARAAAVRVTDRWATGVHPLGIGIGVASGRVTVGAIGETAQMEYTAVGTAVNLAARLCSAAEDGQILLDERIAACANGSVRPRGEVVLKGLTMPSTVYEYI
jgi:class 3 adenylate cyclase